MTLTSIFQSRPSHHFIFLHILGGLLAAMTSTPSPRTSCTLSTLPTEIVEAVAFSLECNDLLLLRLVCRQLWQKTLHPFGKLFETLRTDLSSASLQRLESVSKITPIRQNVQTLLLAKGNNCQFGQDFRWYQGPSSHVEPPFPNFDRLQNMLLHSFSNCRSFRIINKDASEDETLQFLRTDAIAMLLHMIARLDLNIKSFVVDVNHGDLDTTRLQMWRARLPSFLSTWKHLRELSLNFGLKSDTIDWALELIVNATNLQSLSLSLYFDKPKALFTRLCASNACRGLTSLTLASMTVASSQHLTELFCRSKNTLHTLSIWHINIHDGEAWPAVLEQCRIQLIHLQRFSLNILADRINQDHTSTMYHFPSLSEDLIIPESGGRKFTLTRKNRKGGRSVFGVDYSGARVDNALKMLIDAAEPC